MTISRTPYRTLIHVHSYSASVEVLRSANVDSKTGSEADDVHFRGGTVVRLDGPAHTARRRALNRLVRRDGHRWFRDTALFPTAAANLDAVRSTAQQDGLVHADLVAFGLRANIQLAAALVGLDPARTPAGATRMLELFKRTEVAALETFIEAAYGLKITSDVLTDGLEAQEQIRAEFYEPSLERREELVARVRSSEVAGADLPHDILTLIALRADEALADPTVAFHEAMLGVRAAVNTSTQALCWVVEEIHQLLARRPECADRVTTESFLLGAINESLRLNPPQSPHLRRCTRSFTLADGTAVVEGDWIAVHTRDANRDHAVFGSNAEVFDPDRLLAARTQPYGLTFNTGPHMCFGLPIVLGNEGVDGSLVHILGLLMAAGVRPDPDREPRVDHGTMGDFFLEYPVLLEPL